MSLRYDLTKCDSAKLDKLEPVEIQTLIFATVGAGMGEVTATNAGKFYGRVKFLERISGGAFMRNADGTDRPVTPEMVDAVIGMTTNVALESDSKFLAKFKSDLRSSEWEYRRKLES